MGRSKSKFQIHQSKFSITQTVLHKKKKKNELIHRPLTRSMTKNMTEYSFCSIPLKKTHKKLKLKTDSRERCNESNDYTMNPCNSSESMIVLFDGVQNGIFEDCSLGDIKCVDPTNYELPTDLMDIHLDPLYVENFCGCGDFKCPSQMNLELTDEDHKIIEESLSLMENFKNRDKLVKVNSLTDNTIDNLINLYLIDENRPATDSKQKRRRH